MWLISNLLFTFHANTQTDYSVKRKNKWKLKYAFRHLSINTKLVCVCVSALWNLCHDLLILVSTENMTYSEMPRGKDMKVSIWSSLAE